VRLTNASQADVADWLSSPVRMALMLALIFATFQHLQLGLQVVIEDYVPQEGIKLAAVLAVKGLCILMALVCAICTLILGLGA
jgi:succinate dehydrogenase / fumarate reductase membrane anchor subunit